ncbi:aldo/keto reductase [Zavarzinia sp.]|uniref:aldo/keto reductase n=1 Tax=Zavarzinia sp. TaxID=2027920 RepID=UPI003562EA36
MTDQPLISLNDGNRIPQLGLGVWRTPEEDAAAVVRHALVTGYAHVDTAAIYGNERGVGEGIRASGVPREEIFVTTKLWNDKQGYDTTLSACERSLARLGLDYVDLYLIHWPAPAKGLYVETWRALVRLRADGKVRSIGVSNFMPEHISRIVDASGVVPVLNQVELHPRFSQKELQAFHDSLGIATEAWSPLGQGTLLNDPVIGEIAAKHGRTPAQVILRWHLDSARIAIPKSVTPSRIEQNFAVFDFTLGEDDCAAIDALDAEDGRIGPDPLTANF